MVIRRYAPGVFTLAIAGTLAMAVQLSAAQKPKTATVTLTIEGMT